LTDSDIINGKTGGQNVKFEDCDCTKWGSYGYSGSILCSKLTYPFRYGAERYGTVRFIAIIVFILFTVTFPFYCAWLIRKNKPYGSREDPKKCYDEEGHLVEYTDSRYEIIFSSL
jgi:hypothetical protein